MAESCAPANFICVQVPFAKQLIDRLLQLESIKTTVDGLYILHHDAMERTGYATICKPEKSTRYLTRY